MAYKETADYVMDQLTGVDGVRSLPMMGGWLFYIHDRVFGGIFDSGNVLVKITEASRKYMPDAETELNYEGGRDMLVATILDDREKFAAMVREMESELPPVKPRKRKKA